MRTRQVVPSIEALEALFMEHQNLIDMAIRQNWGLVVAIDLTWEDAQQELAMALWKTLLTLDPSRTDNIPRYISYKLHFRLIDISRTTKRHGITKAPPRERISFVSLDAPDQFGQPWELPAPEEEQPVSPQIMRALETLEERERALVEQIMDGQPIKAQKDQYILEAALEKLRDLLTGSANAHHMGFAS